MLLTLIFLGCLAGIISGLIPGIHTNTISILALASISKLSNYFTNLEIASMLIVMLVVHSFLDFIPSIFLGAPEPATALGVLPGHKFLLDGKGYHALKLTILGGLGTFLFSLPLILLIYFYLNETYLHLAKIIAPLLIILSILFILKEPTLKNKIWASIIFLLSGILGLLVLNHINIQEPLFPLFSGLFGISTLLISIKSHTKIPKQTLTSNARFPKISDLIKSSFSSLFVSIFPGIGAAQATIISQGFTKFKNQESFLTIMGGINTAAAFFTLTTLFAINKARNGTMTVLKQIINISQQEFIILLLSATIALGIAIILTLNFGKLFANYIHKISYQKISIIIILFLAALTFYFSNFKGILILITASAIGLLAPLTGTHRIHAMGSLILVVVFYYL